MVWSLEHPLKDEMLEVRKITLKTDKRIGETVKWKSPTFVFEGNMASMDPRTKKHVNLMFHLGASLPGQHPQLEGEGDTVRYMRFAASTEVKTKRGRPEAAVRAWCTPKEDPSRPRCRKTGRNDLRFRTTIQQSGKTATGIQIPEEVVEALESGKRPAVKVTINGYTYRSAVAVMGAVYMIGVSAEHRAGAGLAGCDEVDVDIELDTAPREVSVPTDCAGALDAEAKARRTFYGLSYSTKVVARAANHRSEDRGDPQRRIVKSIAMLRQGRDAEMMKGPSEGTR